MKEVIKQIFAIDIFLNVALLAFACPFFSQGAGAIPRLQEKVAALKQPVAKNQQGLRGYTWTETQETIFKGETKSTKQSQCQCGPDGKVQKTSLSGTQPPPQQRD